MKTLTNITKFIRVTYKRFRTKTPTYFKQWRRIGVVLTTFGLTIVALPAAYFSPWLVTAAPHILTVGIMMIGGVSLVADEKFEMPKGEMPKGE